MKLVAFYLCAPEISDFTYLNSVCKVLRNYWFLFNRTDVTNSNQFLVFQGVCFASFIKPLYFIVILKAYDQLFSQPSYHICVCVVSGNTFVYIHPQTIWNNIVKFLWSLYWITRVWMNLNFSIIKQEKKFFLIKNI